MSSFTEPAIEIRRHSEKEPWTYRLLDQRQRKIARQVLDGGQGSLLLSELAPVITLGRRTPAQDLLMDERALLELGIERVQTDRGGLATYHGPGQWVLFPVDRLARMSGGDSRAVRVVVEKLLRIAQSVSNELTGRNCEIREGAELGVWSEKGKLASVGVHVEEGILLHGLSLNVFRTPLSFVGLRPCGLDAAVDFLSSALDEELFERAKERLLKTAITELF